MAKSIANLIADEHQAVKDYGEKAMTVPAPHAKVIRHIQSEEKQHAKELARINSMAKPPMSKKAAFHEVFTDVPKTVTATGKTGKAKRAMQVAIALSKSGLSKPKK